MTKTAVVIFGLLGLYGCGGSGPADVGPIGGSEVADAANPPPPSPPEAEGGLVTADGGSGPDAEATPTPATDVTGLKAKSLAPTELHVGWTGVADATGYAVAHAAGTTPPADCLGASLEAATTLTKTLSGLTPESDYAIRVCAVTTPSGGGKAFSAGATLVTRTLSLPPGEPSDLVAAQKSGSTDTIDLTWLAASGAISYRVVHQEGSTAPSSCSGATLEVSNNAASVSGLVPNKEYAFRVCARNGNPTPDVSTGVTATAFLHRAPAADPASVTVDERGLNWATVSFAAVAGASGYRVAFAAGSMPADCAAGQGVMTTRTTVTLQGLAAGSAYGVRVCSDNGDAVPLYSGGTAVSVPATPTFGGPPHMAAFDCAQSTFNDRARLSFVGAGAASNYYVASAVASPPTCTLQNTSPASSLTQAVSSPVSSWSFRSPTYQANSGPYVLRLCYYKGGATFEQGETVTVVPPRIVGNQFHNGTCTSSNPSYTAPTVNITAPAEDALVRGKVTVSGTCTAGKIVWKGDAFGETDCTQGAFTATLDVAAKPDGKLTLVAVPMQGAFGGVAAFRTVNKSCVTNGTTCGNGTLEAGETCDLGCGNFDTGACTPQCVADVCGDGHVGVGEECDNGAANGDTSACKSACKKAVCGDGLVGPGEQCDLGVANDDAGACTKACAAARCGDGLVGPGEECDLGAANANNGACTKACKNATCGDGYVGPAEECDSGPMSSVDGSCQPTCKLSTCGDGHVSPFESCDDAASGGCPVDCGAKSAPQGRIAAGSAYACGVQQGAALACWGNNSGGRATPPSGKYTSVAAGTSGACALDEAGEIHCWGTIYGTPPTGPFVGLAVGYDHACARRNDGSVACFGKNGSGQTTVPAGTYVQVVANVYRTCALNLARQVVCWGTAPSANALAGGPFERIDMGHGGLCGLRADGIIKCTGATTSATATFRDVAVDDNGVCGVRTGGNIECLGGNKNLTVPLGDFVAIDGSRDGFCAIARTGTVKCFAGLSSPSASVEFLP